MGYTLSTYDIDTLAALYNGKALAWSVINTACAKFVHEHMHCLAAQGSTATRIVATGNRAGRNRLDSMSIVGLGKY